MLCSNGHAEFVHIWGHEPARAKSHCSSPTASSWPQLKNGADAATEGFVHGLYSLHFRQKTALHDSCSFFTSAKENTFLVPGSWHNGKQ